MQYPYIEVQVQIWLNKGGRYTLVGCSGGRYTLVGCSRHHYYSSAVIDPLLGGYKMACIDLSGFVTMSIINCFLARVL